VHRSALLNIGIHPFVFWPKYFGTTSFPDDKILLKRQNKLFFALKAILSLNLDSLYF